MQRRVAKGAHIAPPFQSPSPGGRMSPNSPHDRSSRLNQRTFGVTNRIWLIVVVLLCLFGLTHLAIPASLLSSSSTPTRLPFSSANLKPKNYLNRTAMAFEPNPFEFCPIFGPGDELGSKYGPLILSQSRLHLGSGARVQKLLQRALAGQPVTISILGGSVSACHGAGDDPVSPDCYPSRFFEWWNSVFPHPATELTNGAMRRTNSGYLAFCNSHHIPDVTDLVIIELDADDIPHANMMENFEILVRSILLRPDQPAVIILGHFSPQIHQTYGFAGPDHTHSVVAQFYDVPHVSTKSVLFPDYMSDPNSIKGYYVDPVLANAAGHDLISDVLVSYFQSQICTAWDVNTGSAFDAVPSKPDGTADAHGLFGGAGERKGVPPEDHNGVDAEGNRLKQQPNAGSSPNLPQLLRVPPGRINTRPNSGRTFEEIAPFCVSANDLINPLPPSLFFGSGWSAFHPPVGNNADALHYWYSSLPTSKIRIPLQVGAGDIGVYYLKEQISVVGEGSSVECWVDDNYAGAVEIESAANIGEPTPTLEIIDHFVGRGSHFIECQLLGEEGRSTPAFKILGVFST